MSIAETERGRSIGSSLFERMTDARSITHHSHEGPARLIFSDRRSCDVEAKLLISRSRFSSWGEEYIHCAAESGFSALDSNDWLTLCFTTGTAVEIAVHEVKAQDGRCRCRFEVKS